MNEVTITVSGPVGSGKSALLGEIEILLKAIGIPLRYADPVTAQSEKNMTHGDWQEYLDMYKPSVVLVEAITKTPAQPQLSDEEILELVQSDEFEDAQAPVYCYSEAGILAVARALLSSQSGDKTGEAA